MCVGWESVRGVIWVVGGFGEGGECESGWSGVYSDGVG